MTFVPALASLSHGWSALAEANLADETSSSSPDVFSVAFDGM